MDHFENLLFLRFMEHYLDNPIWFGLLTGNSHLATGTGRIRYFPPLVTSFAGMETFSPDVFTELGGIIPRGTVKASFAPVGTSVPPDWKMINTLKIHQMVLEQGRQVANPPGNGLVRLDNINIPEMQLLTKLTNPGPFTSRTIDFGNYYGIFETDKLVAMAGQRLQPGEYSEISAVCTHPHHLGKGYAKTLLVHQINLIKMAGKWPVLHVKTDNIAAIRLYESMGFRIRRQFDVIVFSQ